MATDHDRVRDYYATFDEWSRLDSPEGAIELRRVWQVLDELLQPSSRVLDLGGGAGRHAVELARRGHRVTLADLSPALLQTARRRFAEQGVEASIESIDEVNAVDLSRYGDGSFDAVLAFGPYYHLTTDDERRRATAEIARVLRPDGLAIAAYLPRTGGLIGLIERAAQRPEQVPAEVLRGAAETGVFRNASDSGFQEGYYPLPGEIEGLFASAGLSPSDSVSLKSIAHRLGDEVARLAPEVRSEVDQLVSELARRPEILATCGHVLLVARNGRDPAAP